MGEDRTGERLAIVEEKVRANSDEILSLRETRHEHANTLHEIVGRVRENEKAVEAMEEQVVPAIHTRLENQAERIRTMETRIAKTKTDFGWVTRILMFALMFMVAIAQGVLIMTVKNALTQPTQVVQPRNR